MLRYKSIQAWKDALESETAPIYFFCDGADKVNHGWAVCAVGCQIKEELQYDPFKKWTDGMVEKFINEQAQVLGGDFTQACKSNDREGALKILKEITNLPTVF